jgi:hypothetical protein
MNKKGFIHTLEAIIAILLLLGVLIISIGFNKTEIGEVPLEIKLIQKTVLNEIQNNEILRVSLFNDPYADIDNYLEEIINNKINYTFDVCGDIEIICPLSSDLPSEKNIYSDSIIIRINKEDEENEEYRIFKLYLWYI